MPSVTADHLPVKGKAKVIVTFKNGATIRSFVYIVDDDFLAKQMWIQMGIIS